VREFGKEAACRLQVGGLESLGKPLVNTGGHFPRAVGLPVPCP
jgi:hypothetical protein